MILSDKDIKVALKEKHISITPFNVKYLQPASVDLHLDKHFLIFDSASHVAIDPKVPMEDMMRKVTISEDKPFILHPGEFALGMIYEITGVTDEYVGRLEGKSSIGRLG